MTLGNLPWFSTDDKCHLFDEAGFVAIYAAGPASGPTQLGWSRTPARILSGKANWIIHALRWVEDAASAQRIHSDAAAVLGVYRRGGKLLPRTSASRVRRAIDGAAMRLSIPYWSHDTVLRAISAEAAIPNQLRAQAARTHQ